MLADLHLALMVIQFVWSAIKAYEQTPAGNQEYSDIMAVLQTIENPAQTPPPSSPSASAVRPEAKLGQNKAS